MGAKQEKKKGNDKQKSTRKLVAGRKLDKKKIMGAEMEKKRWQNRRRKQPESTEGWKKI